MSETDKKQTYVIWLYGALWAALILILIPELSFSVVSTILFFLLLIFSYIMKNKSVEGDFTHNHTTFIIRTLWFSIFILPAITLTAASIYMLPQINDSSIIPCAQPLADHIVANPNDTKMKDMYTFLSPCMDNFMFDNKSVFMTSTFIAAAPIIIYILYRFGKGTLNALKANLIEKPKNWIV